MDGAAVILIVLLLAYIGHKLDQIEKHAKRATRETPLSVDEEMKELNPDGISK